MTAQEENILFICIENDRILLKVDAQGFVTIGETVVGHEPGLPRIIEEWKGKRLTNSDFNTMEPFEVSLDGIEWKRTSNGSTKYTGMYHGIVTHGQYSYWPYIRNVEKPEFEQGQPVWYRHDEYDRWLFGTFVSETTIKDNGVHELQHNGRYELRPFFVDGVAQHPPFKD